MLTVDQARKAAQDLVERALAHGADAADAIYVAQYSSSVEVRMGALDSVGRSEGHDIGLRLFVGQRSASVSSSDLSDEALAVLAERAKAMATEAPEDPFAGLAPQDRLFRGDQPFLDAADERESGPAELKEWALEAEAASLRVAGVTNSTGAGCGASGSVVALATSHGFAGAYATTGHSISAGVIAGQGSSMQRDSAWHSARHRHDLDQPQAIGTLAGERAVARLNPVRAKPGRMAVLFDPRVSASLLGHLAAAISGQSIARKSSFLQARLGERVFAEGVTIVDDPLRPRGLRSRPFDGEGLPVARMEIITDGVLPNWMAESAAARQLGISPTGHAARGVGGAPGVSPSNFYLAPGPRSREELLKAYPEAILVTELIGQGVNPVTGDYSRGAAGFLVRNGEIVGPVAEITIASNLVEMFATLEPGSDLEFRRGVDAPTVLIPEMTVGAA
jgi:PmbA protein